MDLYGWPVLFALVLWWSSTIVILVLNGLPSRTYPLTILVASGLAVVALYGIGATSRDPSVAGVYCAFACGLSAWGWQILTFYMGVITGPRRDACPPNLAGWARFVEAARTCIHHEFAIVMMAGIIFVSVHGSPNQFGTWTFLVLWWMHLSAKLNLFFGAQNLGEQFLNPRMRYLLSFMRRRPMNSFFPLSVTISTVVSALLIVKAHQANVPDYEAAGYMMLATLMALAVLEHWFLVTPFDADVLWKWGVQPTAIAVPAGMPMDQTTKRSADTSRAA